MVDLSHTMTTVLYINYRDTGWQETYCLKTTDYDEARQAVGTLCNYRRSFLTVGCRIVWGRIGFLGRPKERIAVGGLPAGPLPQVKADDFLNTPFTTLHYALEAESGAWSDRHFRGISDAMVSDFKVKGKIYTPILDPKPLVNPLDGAIAVDPIRRSFLGWLMRYTQHLHLETFQPVPLGLVSPWAQCYLRGVANMKCGRAFKPVSWEVVGVDTEGGVIAPHFSPCGAIVDYARTCYEAPVQFYTDGGLSRLRYYVVPETNARMLGPTIFWPYENLLQLVNLSGTGERTGKANRTYYLGGNRDASRDGADVHGELSFFFGLGIQPWPGGPEIPPGWLPPCEEMLMSLTVQQLDLAQVVPAVFKLGFNQQTFFRVRQISPGYAAVDLELPGPVTIEPVTCVSLADNRQQAGSGGGSEVDGDGEWSDTDAILLLQVAEATSWTVFCYWNWNVIGGGSAVGPATVQGGISIDGGDKIVAVFTDTGVISGALSYAFSFNADDLPAGERVLRLHVRNGGPKIIVEHGKIVAIPDPDIHVKTHPARFFGEFTGPSACTKNPPSCCPSGDGGGGGSGSGGGGGDDDGEISWMPLGHADNFTTEVADSLTLADVTVAPGTMLNVKATIGGAFGLTLTGATFNGVPMTVDLDVSNYSGRVDVTQGLMILSLKVDDETTGDIVLTYSDLDTDTYVTLEAIEVFGLANREKDQTATAFGEPFTGGTFSTGATPPASAASCFAAAGFALAYDLTSVVWGGGFTTDGQDDYPGAVSATAGYRVLSAGGSVNPSVTIPAFTPGLATGGVVVYT